MKKFSLPTSFRKKFVEEVQKLNEKYREKKAVISELYGSLPVSLTGSARLSSYLPKVSLKEISSHIKILEDFQIEFNYLLNSPCLGNLEYTYSGKRKILEFVKSLIDSGVRRFTVTIPYLIELLKEKFPFLKITTSVISEIDSVEKAIFYNRIGADRITTSFFINRNFPLLKEIKKKIDGEVEILLNDACILNCPLRNFHYCFVGHATSESFDISELSIKGKDDPFWERCYYLRLKNPEEFIKSPWIRPEDVKEYEEFVDYFKISGRELSEKFLIKRAEAYLSGSYQGNLNEITNFFDFQFPCEEKLEIVIENSSLEGFIEFFKNNKINCHKGCENCSYCKEVAKKVIKIDEKLREKYIKLLENLFRERLNFEKKPSTNLIMEANIKDKIFTKILKFLKK